MMFLSCVTFVGGVTSESMMLPDGEGNAGVGTQKQ